MKRKIRGRHLRLLADEFAAPRPSLILVHGRRHIGKTRLVLEATAARRCVYFQASLLPDVLNIEQFRSDIRKALGGSNTLDGLDSWEACLGHLSKMARDRHRGLIVVMDSFQNMLRKSGVLEHAIRQVLESDVSREGNLKIVLCGSAMSGSREGAGLFEDRPHLSLEVGRLSLRESASFFPEYKPLGFLDAYAAFGGMPRYLAMCDPEIGVAQNVRDLLFTETGRLFEEPERILRRDLVDIRVYSGIIVAMSEGLCTSGGIARRLGVETKDIMAYLATLQRLGHVTAERSLDADPKTRDVRYELADQLMHLWHAFVRPNIGDILDGEGDRIVREFVQPRWPAVRGAMFQFACRQHAELHLAERLGSPAQETGRIWSRSDTSFDVAGRVADGSVFFGLCHTRDGSADIGLLDELRRRSLDAGYGRGTKASLLLYSLKGFSPRLVEHARRNASLHLIGMEELVRAPDDGDLSPPPKRKAPFSRAIYGPRRQPGEAL